MVRVVAVALVMTPAPLMRHELARWNRRARWRRAAWILSPWIASAAVWIGLIAVGIRW